MQTRPPSLIDSWHAHVYFDAASRAAALDLRRAIDAELGGEVALGRTVLQP